MAQLLIDRIAALFGIAKALECARMMDGPLMRQTDSHHPGRVGHGRARHTNRSQRSRGNRRSAKRAAHIRRMRSKG